MKKEWSKIICWFILCVWIGVSVKGHCHTIAKSDLSEFGEYIVKKADRAYMDSKFAVAIGYYRQCMIEVGSDKISNAILSRLADCYWQEGEFDACDKIYKKLISRKTWKASTVDKIRISNLFARIENYKEAAIWLNGVSGYEKRMRLYMDANILRSMRKDSDCWKISILNINTGYRISTPILADSILFFSGNYSYAAAKSNVDNCSVLNQLYEVKPLSSMFISVDSLERDSSLVSESMMRTSIVKKRIAEVFEGADVSVRKRGKYAYKMNLTTIVPDTISGVSVVRGLDKKHSRLQAMTIDGYKNMYYSYRGEGNDSPKLTQVPTGASNVSPIENNKLNRWVGFSSFIHPTVNKEGTILIFSSNRPGGQGEYDLYVSTRNNRTKEWGIPQNLSSINTIGNEMFPSITQDGYLYFSSDNLPGLGGFDIYRIKLDDAIALRGAIEHLNYPINSGANDYGWTQYADGVSGYFASDRLFSKDRIFKFHYSPSIWIHGIVKNQLTGNGSSKITVLAYDKNIQKVHVAKTDKDGNFKIKLNNGTDVCIRALMNPYDTVVVNTLSDDVSKRVAVKNLMPGMVFKYKQLEVNEQREKIVWAIDTILYDNDRWEIKKEFYPILDKVVSFLKCYPLLNIKIRSYADRRGSDSYDLQLSQQRANSIAKYMIRQGVEAVRIKAKGYGKEDYVNEWPDQVSNCERLHKFHRRTELFVEGVEKIPHLQNPCFFDSTKYKDGDVLNFDAIPSFFFDEISSNSNIVLQPLENIEKKKYRSSD